jgi:hypothetical protein
MAAKKSILIATIGTRDLAFQVSSGDWLNVGHDRAADIRDLSEHAQVKYDLNLKDDLGLRDVTGYLLDNWEHYQSKLKPIILGKLLADESTNLTHIYLTATNQRETVLKFYRDKDTIYLAQIVQKWIESQYQIPTTILMQGEEGKNPSDFEAMFSWWQNKWEEVLTKTPRFNRVMMSVKGGVGAFAEAARITALGRLGEQVEFFDFIEDPDRNRQGEPSEYTKPFRGINYLWHRKQQESLSLLDRYDYEAVQRLLRNELESEDKLANAKLGLSAAVHWNQARFLEFAGELGGFAAERKEQWWWIGYEIAYLAVIRLQQSNTSEAMFHSFRAVEGLMKEYVRYRYPQHIITKDNSLLLRSSILQERGLNNYSGNFGERGDMFLYGSKLFELIKLIKPNYHNNSAIRSYFETAIDRNQLFHGWSGLTKEDLFKIWGCSTRREWENCLLSCLNFITEQNFDSLSNSSLMYQVHQIILDNLNSYQPDR